jgi:5-methyltetrahydropteroyltriglutamate--homocysteine methyltransferase
MTDLRFLTHEIGSLAKPPWLVKTSQGRELEESDIEHARTWGEKVGVEGYEELVESLRSGDADPDEVARWSSRYCVRMQESAGVEVIWDGEQLRSEMYAWAIEHSTGFEPRGTIRSFDNKYYSKSAAVGPVGLREPFHNEEFSFLQSVARADLKIPITGAYTLAIWSYDEHHTPKEGRLGAGYGRSQEIEARRELTLDIARNLIRPNLEALIGLGATWIQIDEPGASTEADELGLFVESFNVSVEGLDCMFSTHLCFSDYDLFFQAIEGMGGCRQYCVASPTTTGELGTSAPTAPGTVISSSAICPTAILRLGVLDIHGLRRAAGLVRDGFSTPSTSSATRRRSTSATAVCERAAGTWPTTSCAPWSRARGSRRRRSIAPTLPHSQRFSVTPPERRLS